MKFFSRLILLIMFIWQLPPILAVTLSNTHSLNIQQNSDANNQALANIFVTYKNGNYSKVIEEIAPLLNDPELGSTLYYLQAICYSRLQEFDKAAPSFDQAIRSGNRAKDLQYEYGQALYAMEKYVPAKKAFAASIRNRYMQGSSLFYLAYINEQLHLYTKSKRYYSKMLTLNWIKPELKQSAHLGLGRILLAQAEATNEAEVGVEDYVIPELDEGIDIDDRSLIAPDLQKLKAQLMKKYDLLGYRMKNGRTLARRRYNASVTQNTQYDTNVVNESDVTTRKALQVSSWYSKTEVQGDYYFPWAGIIAITPSLRAYDQIYLDRDHSNIYANDNYSITPKTEVSWDHSLFHKMGTAYSSIEYNYTGKDYNGMKDNQYYAHSWTYGLGEKLYVFDFGRSSLEVKRKDYQSYTASSNSDTTTFILTQSATMPWGHVLIGMENIDLVRYSNPHKDNNIYLTRFDYLILDLYWGITLNPAFAVTFTDTKEQKAIRGTEVTYNPSLKASKLFVQKHVGLEFEYNYIQNTSDDPINYEYDKHTVGLNLSVQI